MFFHLPHRVEYATFFQLFKPLSYSPVKNFNHVQRQKKLRAIRCNFDSRASTTREKATVNGQLIKAGTKVERKAKLKEKKERGKKK